MLDFEKEYHRETLDDAWKSFRETVGVDKRTECALRYAAAMEVMHMMGAKVTVANGVHEVEESDAVKGGK